MGTNAPPPSGVYVGNTALIRNVRLYRHKFERRFGTETSFYEMKYRFPSRDGRNNRCHSCAVFTLVILGRSDGIVRFARIRLMGHGLDTDAGRLERTERPASADFCNRSFETLAGGKSVFPTETM